MKINTNNLDVQQESVNKTEFVVWDAMMSSGKTQRIIGTMLEEYNKTVFGVHKSKFIYISPYLDEAHRIAGTVAIDGDEQKRPRLLCATDDGFDELKTNSKQNIYYDLRLPQSQLKFCHPSNVNKDGSKETGLKHLIENQANIVSTHNLFKSLSSLDVAGVESYTLVIDEALEAFEFDTTFKASEIERFIAIDLIRIDEDGKTIRFIKENFGRAGVGVDSTEGTHLEQFANDCEKGLIFKVGKKLVRKFDCSILHKFKKVIIMTYNYKGSMFDLLLQSEGINPKIEYFGKTVEQVKPLIKINMDEKLNSVGVPRHPKTKEVNQKYPTLTSTYFKKSASNGDVAYPEINKFFYNKLYQLWVSNEKIPVERRLWTCFKPDVTAISKGTGKTNRFANSWIAFNTKATNDYDETDHLAFLVNSYIDPDFVKVATWNGLSYNQDHYALNTLIQWVFRSAIRKNKPIDVYIPSERMRTLFFNWLDGEVIDYAKEK